MSNRFTFIIAALLILIMAGLAVFSMKGDSATMDEIAHLPAGYSYLTQRDMRLNPEHPPLIKDLAAFPLLFIQGIKFPSGIKSWREDVNGQWEFGSHFLYKTGNPADKMLFWSRVPMVLVLLLLGFYLFWWTRELFGNKAALLSLFLFSFSPTFLAHGRLVTTDVGAAIGIFVATYYFIKSLKNPVKKNIVLAGISFGLAQLCKFSVILLVPYFAFLTLAWALLKISQKKESLKKLFIVHCSLFIGVLVIGFLLVTLIYQFHVLNYPLQKHIRDVKIYLESQPVFISNAVISAIQIPLLRPFAHYLTGLLMVFTRASSGHTTYFLGEISNLGWKNYFPVVYSIKEPLTFHILTLLAVIYGALSIKKSFWHKLRNWTRSHFAEFAMLSFIILYWTASLVSSLNLGVRHLLPVSPFVMVLVSAVTISWLKEPFLKLKYLILGVLLFWQLSSVVLICPHFLSYFNELVRGPDQGFIYAVDSNLDWGQDLRRLKAWTDSNKIEKIYVDYFGGGDGQYYLKEKYVPWRGTQSPNDFPKGNYLAVSATFLQGGRGQPIPGFDQPTGYYRWLDQQTLIAKIGYSIFVYYIE